MTVSVLDVAAYILDKLGTMTTMKLQKLIYYCQAWSLVWDEEPLFLEEIEAWANGPVVRELFKNHYGQFKISRVDIAGDPDKLNAIQKDTVDAVLRDYGSKTSQWLSDLTHSERPWIEARRGLKPGERGRNVISLTTMTEYYEAAANEGVTIDAIWE